MAFRLPRLPASQPPWKTFQLWWQRVMEMLEDQENKQDVTINRIRRLLSHTAPTTILSAVDTGSSCNITVLEHDRVYADGTTVHLIGGPSDPLDNDKWYACYYDDTTLSNTTPTFLFTTDIALAQPATSDGRHFCGLIRTPLAASGVTVESGGAYPAGAATVGGELLALV